MPIPLDKILIIRRDNIGDLLCTTPMIHALREQYPASQITVLANSYNAPVLKNNPDINEVVAYTKAKHSNSGRLRAWRQELSLFWRLRRNNFDLIIHANPTPHPRTARLVRFIGAPYRLGVVNQQTPYRSYNIAISHEQIRGRHHVEQVFSLLAPLEITGQPGPMVLISDATPTRSPPTQSNHKPIIGLHLSSRRPCNRWPEESYAQLIAELIQRGYRLHLFWAPGSQHNQQHPGDDELAARLEHRFQECVTLQKTATLSDLITALDRVDAVICPDGGTLHIAAALQKPVVALFGCTDADTWGPWHTKKTILHGHGSANKITPESALTAILALFAPATTPPALPAY